MNGEQAFTLLLACCCLFAIGTSASMLDPTVSTTPDEVIDVDYASLPLPSEEAKELKRQIQGSDSAGSTTAESLERSATGDETERLPRNDETGESESTGEKSGGPERDVTGGAGDEETGTGSAPKPPSLLDRLLALLQALLAFLLSMLPWLAALLALALAVAFRDRIAARLGPYLDRIRPSRGTGSDADAVPDPNPSDDVARAWVEVVDRLDLARDRSLTVGECVRRAVEAGVDREVVERVARPFEEVQYGGRPVTDGRVERARTGLQRFREQYRDGGST